MDESIALLIGLGLLSCLLIAIIVINHLHKKGSLKILFKDYNRKMWMTFSLGMTFFGLYLLIVCLSRHLLRPWAADLLFLVHQNPVKYIYWGLWIFVSLSFAIYLTRMIIKYFYLTRGKDNQ